MPAELLVGELVRGRQLDVEHVLLRRDERLELGRDLAHLAGAALLGQQPHEVARSSSSAPPSTRSSTSAFTRESVSGFDEQRASSGTSSSARTRSASSLADRVEAAACPARRRTARGRRCGARRL